MSIRINGQTGIDVGDLPITNAGNAEVEGTLTVQGQNVTPFSGFKNYIINGNFDVWQYGTSQTSRGYGSDDRWFSASVGSTSTHSQVVCTDTERALFNASYFSRTDVTSITGVGNYTIKRQSIENVIKLSGKIVTLSFWAKADSNKNIWLEFKQSFGTGGSPSAQTTGIYGQAIPLTTTWQKKTITVTLPSIVGKTLGTDGVHTTSTDLQFWFDVGSGSTGRIPTGTQQSGTFDIAQVQLEEGSVATPFENRPYGLELSLCQRYYELFKIHILGNAHTTNSYLSSKTQYVVAKRTTPTVQITFISQSLNVATKSSTSATSREIVDYIITNAAGTITEYIATASASAEI